MTASRIANKAINIATVAQDGELRRGAATGIGAAGALGAAATETGGVVGGAEDGVVEATGVTIVAPVVDNAGAPTLEAGGVTDAGAALLVDLLVFGLVFFTTIIFSTCIVLTFCVEITLFTGFSLFLGLLCEGKSLAG